VTSPRGRKAYIGFELDCKVCESPNVGERIGWRKYLFD